VSTPEPVANGLDELRVLDLSNRIAGAFASKLFADYGADVIAVEPPAGNPVRREMPQPGHPARDGILWKYLGTNKRSITLDIATETGRRIFRGMVEQANVIIESFAPGTMASLGLDFTRLQGIKRRLILTSITPFGQSGPRANWKATNLTSFASGGQMSLTGDGHREPLVNGGYQAEYQAGLNAFAASGVAAQNADSYEIPQHIDISMQECMAASLELYLPWVAYLNKDISQRKGNMLSAVVGVYPAKEGHVGIHVMPRNWPFFAQAIGRPELANDPRFRDVPSRLANNDELEAIIHEWAASDTAKNLYRHVAPQRAPVSFAHTMADVIASPQLQSREFFHHVDDPDAGALKLAGPPFRMTDVEWTAGRAPTLGEHNAEFYCDELGMARADLAKLKAAGVI
jgi:crotonobetainyl-CoA:carnitine CoA-transferase CaiB-like acyl-CoA transferase